MKRLDLIIDALESCKETSWSMTFDAESVREALAVARELRGLEPVAWKKTAEGIESTRNQQLAEKHGFNIPLYALEQP